MNAGGVVSASPAHWRALNGLSNDYVGYGGEDDDLSPRSCGCGTHTINANWESHTLCVLAPSYMQYSLVFE